MGTITSKIKKLLPKQVLYRYYLHTAKKAVLPDLERRVRDKVYNNSREEKLKRDLTLSYHIVEKGLTMPEPRHGFGRAVVNGLADNVFRYKELNLEPDLEFNQAVSVLREYLEFHHEVGYNLDDEIKTKLERIASDFKAVQGLKQLHISSEAYFADVNASFDKFCMSRYTVRNFTTEEIPLDTFYKCIDLAQKSPSFCNRQPTRVHIVKSAQQKKAILEIQNGNRGFGHLAETLLVISSVISTTKDIHERNENHLNGGMFSMTLLNALHFYKIGACSLNWSVSDDRDQKMREILNIPDSEVVLLVIACGKVPEQLAIASSPRKTAKQITVAHL
ncbi:nitroreductase family protein [uncultured Draconibacterium sp.]|uniref:nitroreductase family protein n=1 Tax=uncultured Draconibacterium sp. TaxID=1573823 RepID=UPI003261B214